MFDEEALKYFRERATRKADITVSLCFSEEERKQAKAMELWNRVYQREYHAFTGTKPCPT